MSSPSPSTASPTAEIWRPASLRAWLGLNAVAMLAYAAAVQLGLAAAVGPGNASLLWPANGVALALMMVWGPRLLPGLVLGGLLPEIGSALAGEHGAYNELGLALLVRMGSAAQWWAMLLLLGNWTARLARPRFALRYVLGALGCCMLAASVSTATLLSAGQVQPPELVDTWLAWWTGDVAGMLIVTPMLLALLHPAMRRHVLANPTFPILALGLGLSLTGSALLGHLEQRNQRERAAAESRAFAQSLGNLMALAEADLSRLAALHYRGRPSAEDFADEATRIRAQHEWLSSFAYLRLLRQADRQGFEALLQQDLRSIAADGSLARAPAQSSYWVVERLSPIGGQEARLGVDEGSEPRRRLAIEGALAQRSPHATPVLDNLVFAAGDEWGVLLYMPVFEGEDGRLASGLVSASIGLRELVEAALQASQKLEFPALLQSSGQLGRGLLVGPQGLREVDAGAARDWLRQVPETERLQQQLRFGDTPWQLHSHHGGSAWSRASRLQGLSLAFGLVCTGLLTGLLLARARRDALQARWHQELRTEVAMRTEELSRLNGQLRGEVAEREQVARELARSAQQLTQREALLSALLQHIPDPVWLKDLQGQFLIVNQALAEFLGQPAASLLGRRQEEFLRTEEAALLLEADRRALAQRGALFSEAALHDAQGRAVLQAQIRVAVRDPRGALTGLLGLGWDISEQRRKEQALQRFRWLADSAAQGFALADLQGRVLYLNAAALQWLGDSRWREGCSRHARRYYGDAAWQRLLDEVLPQVQTRGRWSGMLAPRDRQGDPLAQLLSSFSLLRDAEGRPRYVALLLTDLSERLQLEAELAQARDRAEDANRAKSVFLSNISHEIRTPLNAVLGYAQLLREDDSLAGAARQQIERIHGAGQRLLRLINDVLDLSKIEAGALQLAPEPCELGTELQEALRLMQAQAARGGVELALQLDFAAPLRVSLDRGKFGQVLLNLLGNAVKFSPPGSRVELQAGLQGGPLGERLRLKVRDQGPGIAAEELAQLFQAFRQGESGARHGGTGLGLVLSRRLLQAMGGELGLDSQPGQGSCAWLELPLQRLGSDAPPAGRDIEEGRWQLAPGSRCRVLVAEDDEDSRRLLVALLERLGCTVAAAADGRAALALAEQQDFELVLSDMRMPEMDGVALRQALREQARSRDWPVVAVTASSLLLGREDFLRLGFADYVAKPYAFASIVELLRRHAGVQLQRGSAPTAGATPVAGDAAAGALDEALAWAREGRATALRDWLRTQPPLPAALRAELEQALARYDLQRIEHLLLNALESP